MKIESQYNSSYYRQKPKNETFKGYFACPIKEIHLQSSVFCNKSGGQRPIFDELRAKCSKYFKIFVQVRDSVVSSERLKYKFFDSNSVKDSLCCSMWGQDNKIFLNDKKLGIIKQHRYEYVAECFANQLKLRQKEITGLIEGGNCFLGKKPNGEKFALIGQDALNDTTKSDMARQLEVTQKNLYIISQPDFHLDMAIRPLNYPYVLVGDPNLIKELAGKDKALNPTQINFFKYTDEDYLSNAKEYNYESIDKIKAQLTKFGFKPIVVPGVIGGNNLNFMNAIVHLQDDGSLIYITNNTKISKKLGIDFEGIFSKYLKREVPNVKEVIFIDGKGLVANELKNNSGGIHCMCTERPDFRKWNKFLKSTAQNEMN